MAKRGFAVTSAGRVLIAKLVATGGAVKFTRVVFGTGKVSDDTDIFALTDLVAPLAEGVSTKPIYKDDTVSMILQFRSDLNGGLRDTVWLNEYGLFASDPDGGEVLVCYGNLGDCPDSVLAYKNGCCTVRDYPITVVIGAVADVNIEFPASAFVTSADVEDIVNAAIDQRIHVISTRVRDPSKPDYLGGGGADGTVSVALHTSAYSGTAEITAVVGGTEYDADNMSTKIDAPDGTLIVKKQEE